MSLSSDDPGLVLVSTWVTKPSLSSDSQTIFVDLTLLALGSSRSSLRMTSIESKLNDLRELMALIKFAVLTMKELRSLSSIVAKVNRVKLFFLLVLMIIFAMAPGLMLQWIFSNKYLIRIEIYIIQHYLIVSQTRVITKEQNTFALTDWKLMVSSSI